MGSIWGRGIRRGTNRGRGQGKGHGWGTGQTNETQERTAASGNQDRNDGNQIQDNGGQYFSPMVPMEVEDELIKTEVPTVVMYHKSFQHCEAEECYYHWNAKYMEPPHNMLFRMHCFRMGWDPKKKNKNIGKTSYQMPIFAFVRWIAYRRLSLVLSTNTCTWAITIFRVLCKNTWTC